MHATLMDHYWSTSKLGRVPHTSVLAFLASSKFMAIIQLLQDGNQRRIAQGFHWF